jgi:hypothetical protein
MKNTSSIFTKIATATGLALGAFALSVFATGIWNPAPVSGPPNDNVAAPINVSGGGENNTATYPQKKTGFLTLANFIFNPTLTPNEVTPGSVLTAQDDSGLVGWSNIWGSSGIGCSGTNVLQGINSDGTPNCVPMSSAGNTMNYSGLSYVVVKANTGPTCTPPGSTTCSTNATSSPVTWPVPTGVTSIKVNLWGGGGGGAYWHGSGGAAGYYRSATVAVVGGQILTIAVGKGGWGGKISTVSSGCSDDVLAGKNAGFKGYDSSVSFSGGQPTKTAAGGSGGVGACSGSAAGISADSGDYIAGGAGGPAGGGLGSAPGGGGGAANGSSYGHSYSFGDAYGGAGGAGVVAIYY